MKPRLYARYANGFSLLVFSFTAWRDVNTFKDITRAWALGDIQKGINVPVLFTRYTFTVTRRLPRA